MKVRIFDDKLTLGAAAAACGAAKIREALAARGEANIILATGASQFEMLASLQKESGIDWSRVRIFHLDEYLGLPADHPAGFRLYLWRRFVSKLPTAPAAFYPVDGSTPDPERVCAELGKTLREHPVDAAFIGIGENGHIAFNDPPADFDTEREYLVIELDEKCRRQQLGEGWFPTLADVPRRALSMSVKWILRSGSIINTVPDRRKAVAVRDALEGELTNRCPASILRTHADVTTFLDRESAALLRNPPHA